MKHKSNLMILSLFLFLSMMNVFPLTAAAASQDMAFSNSSTTEFSEITPYSDDIRWVYKTIGTQTYRRRFNYTKNVWIGQWEPYP